MIMSFFNVVLMIASVSLKLKNFADYKYFIQLMVC